MPRRDDVAAVPIGDRLDLSGSRRGPANQRGRAQTGLSPGDAFLAILRAVVARLRREGEQRAVIKGVDVDDAPHAASVKVIAT